MKRAMKNRMWTAVCFVTGMLLCSYPLISSLVERQIQEKMIATYEKEVNKVSDPGNIMEQAREYNRMLSQTRGAVIGEMNENLFSADNYKRQLNVGEKDIMGAVEIPAINVNLPIRHGTSEEVLANGAGHLQESSLPVGGENTRCILTSHRGLPGSKLFTRLDELEEGDLFFINVCGETLAYRIYEIEVIRPEDMEKLCVIPEKDIVSLITCTPYGINTHRLVVNGERVSYEKGIYNRIEPELFSARELIFTVMPFAFSGIMVGIHIKNRRKRCRRNNG